MDEKKVTRYHAGRGMRDARLLAKETMDEAAEDDEPAAPLRDWRRDAMVMMAMERGGADAQRPSLVVAVCACFQQAANVMPLPSS